MTFNIAEISQPVATINCHKKLTSSNCSRMKEATSTATTPTKLTLLRLTPSHLPHQDSEMRILIRKMFNPIQQLNCTSAPWQAKESVILSSRRAVSLGVLLHLLLVCCHGRRGLIIPHLPLLATQLLPLHRDERIQCRVINARALLKQLLPRFLAENYKNSGNSAHFEMTLHCEIIYCHAKGICVQPEKNEGRGRPLGPVGISVLLLLHLALFFGFLLKNKRLVYQNQDTFVVHIKILPQILFCNMYADANGASMYLNDVICLLLFLKQLKSLLLHDFLLLLLFFLQARSFLIQFACFALDSLVQHKKKNI